jgi:putative FmdB family regulatory protein
MLDRLSMRWTALAGWRFIRQSKSNNRKFFDRRTIPSSAFAREVPMPVYDYVCLDCHKPFETVLTLNEHDKEAPKCPHCGSKNVEQEAAAFFAVTSRKS